MIKTTNELIDELNETLITANKHIDTCIELLKEVHDL